MSDCKFMQVYVEENDNSILKILQRFRLLWFLILTYKEKTCFGHIFLWQYVHIWEKICDNTIKDNVTMMSSNFSQNNEMIRILTYFLAKNHSELTIEEINLIQ